MVLLHSSLGMVLQQIVDNHACILLSIKKYTRNPKESVHRKVTAVLRPQQARIRGQLVVYRTDSEREV